jgi:hypothetical protein
MWEYREKARIQREGEYRRKGENTERTGELRGKAGI